MARASQTKFQGHLHRALVAEVVERLIVRYDVAIVRHSDFTPVRWGTEGLLNNVDNVEDKARAPSWQLNQAKSRANLAPHLDRGLAI